MDDGKRTKRLLCRCSWLRRESAPMELGIDTRLHEDKNKNCSSCNALMPRGMERKPVLLPKLRDTILQRLRIGVGKSLKQFEVKLSVSTLVSVAKLAGNSDSEFMERSIRRRHWNETSEGKTCVTTDE